MGKEREMEEELIGAVPCSSLAVDSVLRVGTVIITLQRNSIDRQRETLTDCLITEN